MSTHPAAVPRYTSRILAVVIGYLCIWGATGLALRGFPLAATGAFLLLCCAFLLGATRSRRHRLTAAAAVLLALGAVAVELLADGGALSVPDSWSTTAVAGLALLLLWRQQDIAAWGTMLALSGLLWCAGGFAQVEDAGVLPTALAVGVVAAAGRVLAWYAEQMDQYAQTERDALEWRVAQDAYQSAHQQRIERTSVLAGAMLQRIVAQDGQLAESDRGECRLLHQGIRDETRGRLLLNDAVRTLVHALRRRGAVVQLLDDGHLNHLDTDALAHLHDDIARRIAPLASDRIIIRSGTQRGTDDASVVTIVATSVDIVAAALGEEDDEKVDLWCEIAVPPPR